VRKFITTSSFKKLPAGLLVVFLLFLLTEGLVYLNRANLVTDHWNKFLINEHNLLKIDKNFKYIITGDSKQKTGINPKKVSDDLLNLSLPGGKPLGLYLILKRYFATHEAPKVIFVYIGPEAPRDSLLVILRYFVSVPEFISIWNDLSWKERKVFFGRFWATLDLRKVNITQRDQYTQSNKGFVKEIMGNRGYMPSPRAGLALNDGYFKNSNYPLDTEVAINDRDMKYLDKIVKLASSNGTKIVFLGYVVPEELYKMLKKDGFNKKYLKYYQGLKKRYPDEYFVDEPILYLKNKYFGDAAHLNGYGTAVYTTYFKDKIFDKFKDVD